MKLYHGTNPTFRKSIMKNGFLDRVKSGKSNWSEDIQSKKGFVYLTNTYAFYYAVACSRGKMGSIIQVEVNEEDLYPDEDFIMQVKKMSKEEMKFIDLEDYKHVAKMSIDFMGIACAKSNKVKVLGYRDFNMGEILRYSDPSISLMNHKFLGDYYRKLTANWFKTGIFTNNFLK